MKSHLHASPPQDCVRSIDPINILVATGSTLLDDGLQKVIDALPGVTYQGSCSTSTGVIAGLRERKTDVLIIGMGLARMLPAAVMRSTAARILLLRQRTHMGSDHGIDVDSICGTANERVSAKELRSKLITLRDCPHPRHVRTVCSDCPLRLTLRSPPLPLSDREASIFAMIGNGERPAAIARELGVSVKTIETHRDNIKRKLGLETAMDVFAAALAWKRGDLLPSPDCLHTRRRLGTAAKSCRTCRH